MDSCDSQYDAECGNNVLRKGRKLLAEKKRRARINSCLGQIKSIICGGHKQNDPNYSKMEKAEILESTVKYLRTVRRDRHLGGSSITKEMMVAKYKSGFSKCAEEIANYLQGHPGIPEHLQRQIRRHLSKSVQVAEQTISVQAETYSARLAESQIPTSAVIGSTPARAFLDNSLGSSPVRDGNSFSDSDNKGQSKFGYLSMNSGDVTPVSSPSFGTVNNDSDERIRSWLRNTYVSQGLSKYESREQFSSSPIVKGDDVWRPW